jgi:hypothetical protein
MKSYDNHGHLCNEINTIISNGKQIVTNTSYSNYGGEPKVQTQTVGVRDLKTGKQSFQTFFGGKLLP